MITSTEKGKCILLADYVPLANKGEEAIVRGIEDMLSEYGPLEIGLFDNVAEVTCQGNITVFPKDWIFRLQGGGCKTGWGRVLKAFFMAVEMRLGYYSKLRNLVSSSEPKYKPLHDFFNRADCILVGHDGVFYIESCAVIHLARKAGKKVGILGSGSGIRWHARPYLGWIYRRSISECDFCVLRESFTYDSMKYVSRDSDKDKLVLAPDPAFAMRPSDPEEARRTLENYESCRRARESGKAIIGATVLETGIVYNYFTPESDATSKSVAHARYLAEILDDLIEKRNGFVVFLPHSVEKNANDITTARNVVAEMNCNSDNHMILDKDLRPQLLKSIIREFDFLVGERTHSIIASISVATPFVALTCRQDYRTHGIVGDMADCRNQVIDINVLDAKQASRKTLDIFDDREAMQISLQQTSNLFEQQLSDVAKLLEF